ncbi:MAG: colicin Z C-terminal domain-related protein [Methylococcaceae bacterium]
MQTERGWAPPRRVWGPWVEFGAIHGKRAFKIEFDSISNAPSSFDAEVKYWDGPKLRTDITHGPGYLSFTAQCMCIQRIRFRSHTIGQMIRIFIK